MHTQRIQTHCKNSMSSTKFHFHCVFPSTLDSSPKRPVSLSLLQFCHKLGVLVSVGSVRGQRWEGQQGRAVVWHVISSDWLKRTVNTERKWAHPHVPLASRTTFPTMPSVWPPACVCVCCLPVRSGGTAHVIIHKYIYIGFHVLSSVVSHTLDVGRWRLCKWLVVLHDSYCLF